MPATDPVPGDSGTLPLPRAEGGGSRPIPDPTELTDRAIARLERSLTQYVDGEIKVLRAELEGEVILTKERFAQSEGLRVEQKQDTKAAVDSALAAAKEAVVAQTVASERSIDKSERATAEQLKQQQDTFGKTAEGLSDKIEDVKERVGRLEGSKTGSTESRTALYATVGLIVTVVLAAMALITFGLAHLSP